MKIRYYPGNLTPELLARWPAAAPALPAAVLVEQFISIAYQASLLQEEGRPVRYRLLLCAPAQLVARPLTEAHYALALTMPRPYEEQEIRRLSPALHATDSLLAVQPTEPVDLLIWGLLRQPASRAQSAPLPEPALLLLDVRGPGNLVFYCGSQRLLTLQQGTIAGHGFLEYPVAWGRGRFAENNTAVLHLLGLTNFGQVPGLQHFLVQLWTDVIRRLASRVRSSGHGGMLVFVPTQQVAHYVGSAATLRPKYQVQLAASHYYIGIEAAIVQRLLVLGDVSWARYQQATDPTLVELQKALGHYAKLLADLTAVDGALVLTKQLAVVGFGMEVYAPQLTLTSIYRALNADGTQRRAEAPDAGGTRHRAAYRLCLAHPDCEAIVLSQDGGVRFVHSQADHIVFWEQLAIAAPAG